MTDMHPHPITADASAAMPDPAFADLPHPDTKR